MNALRDWLAREISAALGVRTKVHILFIMDGTYSFGVISVTNRGGFPARHGCGRRDGRFVILSLIDRWAVRWGGVRRRE
jgi:hypothetical protein